MKKKPRKMKKKQNNSSNIQRGIDYFSPEDYRTQVNTLLKCIEDAYANSKCNELKKCEQVFVKRIGEIQKTFKETENICYEKIYRNAVARYNNLISEKINQPLLILSDKAL